MISINPDKFIRKAVHDLINNIVVSSKIIKSFDSRVSGNANLTEYVLFTAQTKEIEKATKCGYRWECSLLLDIVTIYKGSGNTGSRVKGDDIQSEIYELIKNIEIPNYIVINRTFVFQDSLSLKTPTENIFRNFIRVELLIN